MDAELLALGNRVEGALRDALTALSSHDLALADGVVRADLEVNRHRYQIEDTVSGRLATTADSDRVRRLVAVLYVLADLERMGDHAEGIAKVALMLGAEPRLAIPRVILEMAERVRSIVRRTLIALREEDAPLARALCAEDDEVDALYDRAYAELLSEMAADRQLIGEGTYLIWATHNLERIADRATNVCERVVYLVTGRVEELNVSKY